MAEFTPAKKLASDFNGGQEYEQNDGVSPSDWNNLIESALYTQEQADSVVSLATNQPDTSLADNVGTPTVTIEDTDDGKQFKFANLKGETPNVSATATVGNTVGTPSVTVTKTGNGENTVFNFDFENIKGETGATGASSINSALVTNVDGDSEVNTFSQKFIKGGAQAKNYYNLGAYDTYVSNGNGTGTVTVGTEIEGFDGSEKWSYHSGLNGRFYRPLKQKSKANNAGATTQFVKINQPLNLGTFTKDNSLYVVNDVVYIRYDAANGNINEFKKWLSQNPLVIQYATVSSYSYNVIENYPIRPANQEEELYWHEEWRKGLNLITNIVSGTEMNSTNGGTLNNPLWYTTDYIEVSPQTVYTQSGFSSNSVCFYDENKVFISSTITEQIIPPANCRYIRLNSLIAGYSTPMLVKGSHPYPYELYHGGIVREKDLSGIQLFPEGVNPAQTIGGDWEDEGTVTTSNNTILHAYRRLS